MATAELMDGRELAAEVVDDARGRAEQLAQRMGRPPCLATVLIGDDPASVTYVQMKQNRCRTAGIESRRVSLAASTSTASPVPPSRRWPWAVPASIRVRGEGSCSCSITTTSS